MRPLATEQQYAAAAAEALADKNYKLALEQLGAALSFAPTAAEHLAMLDLILASVSSPLTLLGNDPKLFFGSAAVKARILARSRDLPKAIELLFDVAEFRPDAGYLAWLAEWSSGDLKGIEVDRLGRRVARYLELCSPRPSRTQRENLLGCASLLEALGAVRPKARLALLQLEVAALRRCGERHLALERLSGAAGVEQHTELLGQRGVLERESGELELARATLERACSLIATGSTENAAVKSDLADTLMMSGMLAEALAAYDEVVAMADDPRLRAHAETARAYLAMLCSPENEGLAAAFDGTLANPSIERADPLLLPLATLYRTELPPLAHPLALQLEAILRHVAMRRDTGQPRITAKTDLSVPSSAGWPSRPPLHPWA